MLSRRDFLSPYLDLNRLDFLVLGWINLTLEIFWIGRNEQILAPGSREYLDQDRNSLGRFQQCKRSLVFVPRILHLLGLDGINDDGAVGRHNRRSLLRRTPYNGT